MSNFIIFFPYYQVTYSLHLNAYTQCRGKLLLKVMRYNIALLPKKVTNYIT